MTPDDILYEWADNVPWLEQPEMRDILVRLMDEDIDPLELLTTIFHTRWNEVSTVIITDREDDLIDGWDNVVTELQLGYSMFQQYPSPTHWINQGVMLLFNNDRVSNVDWSGLVSDTIRFLSKTSENVVFIFLGKSVHGHSIAIDKRKHLVLKAGSPVGDHAIDGFFGSIVFAKATRYHRNTKHKLCSWGMTTE